MRHFDTETLARYDSENIVKSAQYARKNILYCNKFDKFNEYISVWNVKY